MKKYRIKGTIGAFENYTFKEKNGTTEVLVEIDSPNEHQEMSEKIWPKALQKLKYLAEK